MGNYIQRLHHLSLQALAELRRIPILKVILALLPYLTYLVVFSSYKTIRHITHLDAISKPHFAVLSHVEKALFFCHPHRILSRLANPLFDMIAAVPYLIHFPLPFLFTFYLAISERRREALLPYLWCVGFVSCIAVVIQTVYPTAPPWFTDSAVLNQHGNVIYEFPVEAGFSRLDKLFGFSLFHGLYSASPLKFGAFPSLHVALPTTILLNHPWLGWKFGMFHVILITLSALYIQHHYLIDALGAIAIACIVRLCMFKIWSPFSELKKDKEPRAGTLGDEPKDNIVTV